MGSDVPSPLNKESLTDYLAKEHRDYLDQIREIDSTLIRIASAFNESRDKTSFWSVEYPVTGKKETEPSVSTQAMCIYAVKKLTEAPIPSKPQCAKIEYEAWKNQAAEQVQQHIEKRNGIIYSET